MPTSPQFSHLRHARPQCAGFALVIALSLMAFVLLLLMSMVALTRVETRSSETQRALSLARVNALIGMQEAIGQVQKTMGPDQRVSANADLVGSHPQRSQIVGAWSSAPDNTQVNDNTYDRGDIVGWLVSDAPDSTATSTELTAFINSAVMPVDADHVPLVWTGSLGDRNDDGAPDDLNDAVVVDLRARVIDDNGATTGRYGWWVGDEGVKARVNLERPQAVIGTNAGKNRSVLESMSSSVSRPTGWVDTTSGTAFPNNIDLETNASRLLELDNLSLLPNAASDVAQPYFHDLTTWSSGVLADVVKGDLKKDLSLAFEMDDATFSASEFAAGGAQAYNVSGFGTVQPVFVQPNETGVDAYGPVWNLLREYYRIYHRMENPMTDPTFEAQIFGPNLNHSRYSIENVDNGNDKSIYDQPVARLSGGVVYLPIREETEWQNEEQKGAGEPIVSLSMWNNGPVTSLLSDGGDPFRSYASHGKYKMGGDQLTTMVSANYMPYLMRSVSDIGFIFDRYNGAKTVPDGNGGRAAIYQIRRTKRSAGVLHNPFNVKLRHKDLAYYMYGLNGKVSIYPEVSTGAALYKWENKFIPYSEAKENTSGTLYAEDKSYTETFYRISIQGGEGTIMEPGEITAYEGLPRKRTSAEDKIYSGNEFSWHIGEDVAAGDSNQGKVQSHFENLWCIADNNEIYDISVRPDEAHFNGDRYSQVVFQMRCFMNDSEDGFQFDNSHMHRDWPMSTLLATIFTGPGANYTGDAKGEVYFPMADDGPEGYVTGPPSANKPYSFYKGSMAPANFQPGSDGNLSQTYPLMRYDLQLKPSEYFVDNSGSNIRYPVFAMTNPLAPVKDSKNLLPRDDKTGDGAGFNAISPGWAFSVSRPSADISTSLDVWGPADGTAGGVDSAVLLELPTAPVLSLGKLQFTNVSVHDHMPALAISNSLASPYVPRDQSYTIFENRYGQERFFPDLSYLMNEALWDSYYFSSLSLPYNANADDYDEVGTNVQQTFNGAFDTQTFDLPNPRVALALGEDAIDDVRSKLFDNNGNPSSESYIRAAENLVMTGAFNVNSTSEAAWFTVLAGARERSVAQTADPDDLVTSDDSTAFPRFAQSSFGEVTKGDDATGQEAWGGFRSIADDDLRSLARAIVQEIRDRTAAQQHPYLSLGEFVNRRLTNDEYGLRGVLQAAIDKSGINAAFHLAGVDDVTEASLSSNVATFPHADNMTVPGIGEATANMSAPAYLLQADILQSIGSFLTARSDTFRIRSYGESFDAVNGSVKGKAWCEAIIQRRAEPIDPNGTDSTRVEYWSTFTDPVTKQNPAPFGRKFEVVSFRWLSESDI
ncbi:MULTISPECIES: hypothetical protein [unclassified Lentimonas]|uniref:hypothetical protein n=1 Tax=unclassified Lentimonas TaxID=2630993 RepID=UPI00132AB5FD|nr:MULTISPECIES: hypothetical protein [unclassified Lentimonas]CAA6679342.1 Unannotated [Lentimonas sp. CC4]CAA6686379.1 Unannotated [Lentimonas sp. CC6]CAA7076153.1 Unannotated [Lentimonas sp. CC4]CAA7170854.1 Unannotated [Lentimonas sp. CC21]CAA7181204.1 Unannotated [Lentimonas sp. CC8]